MARLVAVAAILFVLVSAPGAMADDPPLCDGAMRNASGLSGDLELSGNVSWALVRTVVLLNGTGIGVPVDENGTVIAQDPVTFNGTLISDADDVAVYGFLACDARPNAWPFDPRTPIPAWPAIERAHFEIRSPTEVVITWSTTGPTVGRVAWARVGDRPIGFVQEDSFAINHSFVVVGLRPGEPYAFRIIVFDPRAQIETYDFEPISTPSPPRDPWIDGLGVGLSVGGSVALVGVNWAKARR